MSRLRELLETRGGYLEEAQKASKGPKVTIYSQGAFGAIDKVEGYLAGVRGHGKGSAPGAMVDYVGKRGRKVRTVWSMYSPFIMVVEGWGHPDPESLYDPATATGGEVTTMRGRRRGTDPGWVDSFLAGPGKKLKSKIVAIFKDGKLSIKKPGVIPKSQEESEGSVGKLEELMLEMRGRVLSETMSLKDIENAAARWVNAIVAAAPSRIIKSHFRKALFRATNISLNPSYDSVYKLARHTIQVALNMVGYPDPVRQEQAMIDTAERIMGNRQLMAWVDATEGWHKKNRRNR
jgi:hypothetical protein